MAVPVSAYLQTSLLTFSVHVAWDGKVNRLLITVTAPHEQNTTQYWHVAHFEWSATMPTPSSYLRVPKLHSTVHLLHLMHLPLSIYTMYSGGILSEVSVEDASPLEAKGGL